MKNQGISLIALIITIIVIIILAAIVIFTGLGTPDSAQFSAFTNDVDSVYMAVIDKFAQLKVDHAISGDARTTEQIYIELATGKDHGQYVVMNIDDVANSGDSVTKISAHTTDNTRCQLISNGATEASHKSSKGAANAYATDYGQNTNKLGLGLALPKVRQTNESWYVTADGRIFNATGFIYNGKTYYNATYFSTGEKPSTHSATRAGEICAQMYATGNNAFEVTVSE